mgnify:CR=1 FL=1
MARSSHQIEATSNSLCPSPSISSASSPLLVHGDPRVRGIGGEHHEGALDVLGDDGAQRARRGGGVVGVVGRRRWRRRRSHREICLSLLRACSSFSIWLSVLLWVRRWGRSLCACAKAEQQREQRESKERTKRERERKERKVREVRAAAKGGKNFFTSFYLFAFFHPTSPFSLSLSLSLFLNSRP